MQSDKRQRRAFLKSCALAAATIAVPWARAQTSANPAVRLEWQRFRTTSFYTPFLGALADMKANRNALDRNSWQYWVNVHRNYCPHDVGYFLSWHRGYLASLEKQLRIVTGMSNFALPYWDYYTNPQMPAEFLDAATGNPLYVTSRVGSNVRNALSLAPFGPTVTNFRRGLGNAFETLIETQPHNPVHNLIGGRMSSMSSPQDPIFFLHHGNIDRLWLAWVRAGAGRAMAPRTHSYWAGTLTYATDLTMARVDTWDTRTDLHYDYNNTSMPTTLPIAQKSRPELVQVQAARTAPALPAIVNAPRTAAGKTGSNTYSVGGVRDLTLDERSVSVQVPVSSPHTGALQTLARSAGASLAGSNLQFKSARIVLDDLEVSSKGEQGGYFYYVYLNLPASPDYATPKEDYLLGTIGAFEVDAGRHHGSHSVRRYPITDKLAGLTPSQIANLTISFVRVDGDRPPSGQVLHVGEVRVELSTDN